MKPTHANHSRAKRLPPATIVPEYLGPNPKGQADHPLPTPFPQQFTGQTFVERASASLLPTVWLAIATGLCYIRVHGPVPPTCPQVSVSVSRMAKSTDPKTGQWHAQSNSRGSAYGIRKRGI